MFRIQTIKENNFSFVILQNATQTTAAKICLNQGARIQDLKFNNTIVIEEQKDFNYKNSYASSILFPFVSRIKAGKYQFLSNKYQLVKNDNNTNALHGLVFDKYFEVFEPETHKDNCSITLNYYEKKGTEGFPFQYYFSVTYTLFENYLTTRITVKNKAKHTLPFTLGWHPYFKSDNLSKSSLAFKSNQKITFDENLITKEIVDIKTPNPYKIKNQKLDDCFILDDNRITFNTPKYSLEITSDTKNNFLQLYTPENKNLIAIEPMTGVSNSFNNNIGLQVLEPEETYVANWKLKFLNE